MKKEDWVWMPHAGHLIIGRYCRFHLATCVGRYIVSTVGEYLPPEGTRERIAKMRGVQLEGRGDAREDDYLAKIGYEEIGHNRKYETMVFLARRREGEGSGCCPWTAMYWSELEALGANDADAAVKNHLRLCDKYASSDDAVESLIATGQTTQDEWLKAEKSKLYPEDLESPGQGRQ